MPGRIFEPGVPRIADKENRSPSHEPEHEQYPVRVPRNEAADIYTERSVFEPASSTRRFGRGGVNQAATTILRFQRNVGNQYVQKLLQPGRGTGDENLPPGDGGSRVDSSPTDIAATTPPRQLIQRQPDSPMPTPANQPAVQGGTNPDYRPTAATFVPIISKDEDATIKVYEHHIHSFSADNTQDAPEGATFRWGGGIIGSGGQLKVIGKDDQDGGTSTNIWVQGRKPGEGEVQATLVHQVPGGPEGLSPTEYANVTVATPTVELVSIHSLSSGTFKVHIGDTFKARLYISNIDAEHAEVVNTVAQTGEGVDCVTLSNFEQVSSTGNAQVVDLVFEAKKAGIVNMDVYPAIGDMSLGGTAPKTNIQLDVLMNKQDFLNRCSQCNTTIDKAFTRVNTVMETLSAAYGNAYDGHIRTLEAQDASNRLVGEIILGAALAFIPGGVGGVVGNFMKEAEAGNFLSDAIKDMAKAGVKGVQGVLPGSGSTMPPALATDPRTWRANYVQTVNGSKEAVLTSLESWQQAANTDAEGFAMNFDPVEHTEKSLVDKSGNPYESTAVPPQLEHQKKFELGFWKEWLSTYGFTVEYVPGCPFGQYVARENQGKKIRDRIDSLGGSGDDFLSRYGGISKRAAEAEVERRNKARFSG